MRMRNCRSQAKQCASIERSRVTRFLPEFGLANQCGVESRTEEPPVVQRGWSGKGRKGPIFKKSCHFPATKRISCVGRTNEHVLEHVRAEREKVLKRVDKYSFLQTFTGGVYRRVPVEAGGRDRDTCGTPQQ